jgi:hypothetical protein
MSWGKLSESPLNRACKICLSTQKMVPRNLDGFFRATALSDSAAAMLAKPPNIKRADNTGSLEGKGAG